jgi:hypothetical protein
MVSTISFIQANLQHSIAASRILTGKVVGKVIDMVLIQEPWFHHGCIRDLNFPGYSLFSVNGADRPRVCIFTRIETAWMLPGFSCRNLVAVLINYNEEGVERRVVVRSAYLPYDLEDPPQSKEFMDLLHYCEKENLYLVVGCDSNARHSAWGGTNCNSRGEDLVEFLNTTTLEILNWGKDPTFCSGGRLKVIDITLGSLRLLDSVIDREVSSEPSV